ncbi:MAG: hypothetical protein HY742_05220 [Deltaproteobacteria bacterium]|nr:hypothetical protein [Deltaproteobacteria bacterium]
MALKKSFSEIPLVHPHAAGIDSGATFHVVAVSPNHDPAPVRQFQSFTTDLHKLSQWLRAIGVKFVAMESTGIYWIPVGLLRASFRPSEQIATLRAYLRHRERLIEYSAAHIQHMQKALMQMNLPLHHVVSDITGATGMKIIRDIIQGERCAAKLAAHRDIRCKKTGLSWMCTGSNGFAIAGMQPDKRRYRTLPSISRSSIIMTPATVP